METSGQKLHKNSTWSVLATRLELLVYRDILVMFRVQYYNFITGMTDRFYGRRTDVRTMYDVPTICMYV